MGTRIWHITDPDSLSADRETAILTRIILLALSLKLLIAFLFPLALDEAYAIAAAREYSLSFFDHPPISFWAPVAMADLLGIENRFVFRLPFLLAGVLTTWLIYRIGCEIHSRRAGLWAALLYSAAPFFLISGGFMVVPDGMLNLGLAMAVLFLMKIVKAGERAPLVYWIVTGLALAFALGSKYQAAWLPVAVLIFMLATATGRRWFSQPGPWLGGLIGLLGLLPVLLWNSDHDWISFAFHGSRAGGGLNAPNLIWMLLAQMMFLLPTGLIGAFAGLRLAFFRQRSAQSLLLGLIALGPILIFNIIYLTSSTSLAHWTMPGWMFALPLAGVWLASRSPRQLRRFLGWTCGFFALIWLPLITLTIHGNTGFLTRPFYDTAPDWDETLSIFDFRDLRPALKARGLWQDTDLFMASSWAFAGIFDTAFGGEKPMQPFQTLNAHHFAYLSDANATGKTIFLEASVFKHAAATDARVLEAALTLDDTATLLEPITLTRGGQPYVHITLVRLTRR